jgi:hypothetical protein
MTTDLLLRPASYDHRPWDRLLVRLRAPSLDRQLAAGRSPGSGPALVLRAGEIISPPGRRELAQRWEHVLDLARRPPAAMTPRGPLCRGRIAAAERDVQEMLAVLTGALPITARGAAMASVLLSDGIGPLHNRRSPLDLGAEVRQATTQMGTFAGALTDGADRDGAGCVGWHR